MSESTIEAQIKEAFTLSSLRETSDKLLEIVYANPCYFSLAKLDEDSRSSFLVSLSRVLPHLLYNYDRDRTDLMPYLFTFIRLYLRSWQRTAAKKQAAADSLHLCYGMEIEDSLVAEHSPDYADLFKDARLPPRCKRKSLRDMLLALALKNCWMISDKQLSLIIAATGINPDTMMAWIQEAKDSIQMRVDLQKELIYRRNKAFFLKTKYRLELERLDPASAQYEAVDHKFRYQCRVLDTKNQILRERSDLSPSNTNIAATMDLPVRRVNRLLEMAREGRLEELLQKEALNLESYRYKEA
jgi:hypothetical protein